MKRSWVVLLIVLAWLPVLGASFYWDDHPLVLSNPQLSSVGAIFGGDLGGAMSTPFYRPLFLLSVALDQALWPGWAPGYHLQDLGWHALSIGILFALVRQRAGEEVAVCSTLLFGLHPLQVEAVAWVSARNDPMCAAGVLGALWSADRRQPWLVGVLTLLAALAKEQALLLPLALPLWRLAWRERPEFREVVASGLGVGLVLLLRHHAQLLPINPEPRHLELFWQRWPLVPGHYLGWLLWPWPLSSSASLYAPLPGPWLPALLTLGGLGAILRLQPRLLAHLALALLFLAPAVVAVAATTLIGERYLYLPLAFLGMMVGMGIPAAQRRWMVLWTVLALGLLELRLLEWRSEATLVERAAERSPDAYTLFRLGLLRNQQGEPKAAFSAFMASLQSDPPFLSSCAPPLKLLAQIGAMEQARQLQKELTPICGEKRDFVEALQQ